jgi:hypothetical protein
VTAGPATGTDAVDENDRWERIAAGADPRTVRALNPQLGDCQPEFEPIPAGRPTATVIRDLADYPAAA